MKLGLPALALLWLGLAACRPAAPEPAPAPVREPASAAADIRGQWRLAEMNGRTPAQAGADAAVPITMTVGDSTFRAQSQCIAIWRRYERRGDRFVVSAANPGAMCARGLSPWETEFERALSGVSAGSRSAGELRLWGPSSELVFQAAPPPAREGFVGGWRLRRLNGQSPPATDQPLEITVADDRISANACVFAGWRYRQDGQLLEITPLDQPVCERTLTDFERRFGVFMDGLIRATILQDGSLILDSAAEQAEFDRLA